MGLACPTVLALWKHIIGLGAKRWSRITGNTTSSGCPAEILLQLSCRARHNLGGKGSHSCPPQHLSPSRGGHGLCACLSCRVFINKASVLPADRGLVHNTLLLGTGAPTKELFQTDHNCIQILGYWGAIGKYSFHT